MLVDSNQLTGKAAEELTRLFASVYKQPQAQENLDSINRLYLRAVTEADCDKYNCGPTDCEPPMRGSGKPIRALQAATVLSTVRSNVATLAELYLSTFPLFEAIADPEHQVAADKIEHILSKQQVHAGWNGELVAFFRNLVKYNTGAMHVDWAYEYSNRPAPSYLRKASSTLQASSASLAAPLWQGNRLTNLDLYNTFWDTRVRPTKAHVDGEYAGYTERLPVATAKQRLQQMKNAGMLNAQQLTKALSMKATSHYVTPTFERLGAAKSGVRTGNSFQWFFGRNMYGASSGEGIELTHMYVRVAPKDLYFTNVQRGGTVQVLKLLYANGVPVYAKFIEPEHSYLPIVVTQLIDEDLGYSARSIAENVGDYQMFIGSLLNAKVASLRRMVSDRMIYDPSAVSEKDIKNASADAKIPLRPRAWGRNPGTAVYPVPYRDDSAAAYMGDIQLATNFADQASGLNAAQRGQFTRGNRTAGEFAAIMAASGSGTASYAYNLDSTFFQPLKEIVAANLQHYQPSVDLPAAQTLNSSEVAATPFELTFSGGMNPANRIAGTEFLSRSMELFTQIPQLAQDYDIGAIWAYIGSMQGVNQLEKFRRAAPLAPVAPAPPIAP